METPSYEVWAADLDSLYGEPRPPVFVEDVDTLTEAHSVAREIQDHRTAAWVVDKETRSIIPPV